MERNQMIYNHILQELLGYFSLGSYKEGSKDELQADFKTFTTTYRKLYREVLDSILEGITDLEHETWRTFKLNYKRLKVCKVCGEPFYCLDKMNQDVTCYKQTYTRHNKQGEPMKMNGKSECYMQNRRNITQVYRNNKTKKDGNL